MYPRVSVITTAICMLLLAAPALAVPTFDSQDVRCASLQQSAITASVNYTYRNFTQVKSELIQIESQHPAIAKVYDIGDSWEKKQGIADRDILAIKISDNVIVDEDEPEVLVTALHHAREWITAEIALELARKLTDGYGTDQQTSWLVDNREVWIVSIVNPDGLDYSLTTDDMWRKNRRMNPDLTYGVDLNRNYNGSSNGDPLGSWGGVGSSTVTSSELYCGSGPFSEPETQAVRDLIVSHDFSIALDFHSYGNLVLWPWGYTANHTAAHEDLSRIGSELAVPVGYVSEQSVALYPTTGDYLDWAYGFADIYPFTFEVGSEFHPMNSTVVNQIVSAIVDASLLGIEIAGDREEKAFRISHVPINTANYTSAGYPVFANVTAERGVNDSSVSLVYSTDGSNWTSVQMAKSSGNDTYLAHLPSVSMWHVIDYYISAKDLAGVSKVAPDYAPYWMYSLMVTPPPELIGVSYFIPQIIDGTNGYDFNVSLPEYPEAVGIRLELNGSETERYLDWTLPARARNYTCEIPSGEPLGDYSSRIVATVDDFVVWTSSSFPLEIQDATPPSISAVEIHIVESDSESQLSVDVMCSDFYGVESVTLTYSLNGGQVQTATQNSNDNRTNPSLWSFEIPIGKGNGLASYRVTVRDSQNEALYPAEGFANITWEGRPSFPLVQLVIAGAILVSALAVAYAVIRARRRPGSGP